MLAEEAVEGVGSVEAAVEGDGFNGQFGMVVQQMPGFFELYQPDVLHRSLPGDGFHGFGEDIFVRAQCRGYFVTVHVRIRKFVAGEQVLAQVCHQLPLLRGTWKGGDVCGLRIGLCIRLRLQTGDIFLHPVLLLELQVKAAVLGKDNPVVIEYASQQRCQQQAAAQRKEKIVQVALFLGNVLIYLVLRVYLVQFGVELLVVARFHFLYYLILPE